MVRKITYSALIFEALMAGWVVLFYRIPGQGFPREMVWIFYISVIPIVAQCSILVDKSFWSATWKDGLPISPTFEKRWSEKYLFVQGMCAQNRKNSGGAIDGRKYESMYNLRVTGSSGVVLSKGIRIGRVLVGMLGAMVIIAIITTPNSSNAALSLKGQLATSWPVVWVAVVGMQFILFGTVVLATYWIAAKFVCLFRGGR